MDPVAATIKTYDDKANEFRDRYLNDSDSNNMEPLLDNFIMHLGSGKKILDIGSGAGFDSKYFAERGYDVTGIDLSDNLLKLAQEFVPNAKFIKMDMRKLSFANESFDGVWANGSLLHLPKKYIKSVLTDIYRIVRPTGIVFVGLKEGEGEKFVENNGNDNLPGAVRYFSYFTENEFVGIAHSTGLKLVNNSKNDNRGNVWLNLLFKK